MGDLKNLLGKLSYQDSAGVQKQLVDQILAVKMRMAAVRRKILILSGKGGVGKSAVTTQLAIALARSGKTVGILDADLNGPCVPKMLGLEGKKFTLTAEGAEPPRGPFGIKVASMSFLLESQSPVRWKGPMDLTPVWLGMMESGVIREFLSDIAWGELDYLLFDLPPGAAADKPPTLCNFLPELDGAIVVSTPSAVAVDVVRKSIEYAKDLGIRILGLVENMGAMPCPYCGHEVHPFGDGVQILARDTDLALLARIPMDLDLGRSLENGISMPEAHPVSRLFQNLATTICETQYAHSGSAVIS